MESEFKLKALKRSTIAIVSVVIVEVVLGLAAGSLAIISDGLHASLDALTTFMLFIVTRMSAKPPDEEHMYGHEKFESIGGFVGGIVLTGFALLIIFEAVLRIVNVQTVNFGIEYVGFVAVIYTFCIDVFRVRTFLRARGDGSSTMKAGFYHALADLSSTIIAFLGFGLATVGIYFGDSVASMILGVLLIYLSMRLIWSGGRELTDAIPRDLAGRVRREILGTKGVCSLEDLKIRRAGEKTYIRATLRIPNNLGLKEAHDVSSKVEARLKGALGNAEVIVHTEPCEEHMPSVRTVEELAREVEGVVDVHEINVVYTEDRLYITLHAHVDPKLSIERAHEIAERIEEKIKDKIGNVEDVAVHVEPSVEGRRGTSVDEVEVRAIIGKVAEDYKQAFRIKRIVTYVAGDKRYINIACALTKDVSVEEAHEIVSQIEEQIKEHFLETAVTVYLEPM